MTSPPPAAAVLLDSNVLIALSVGDHVHHARARTWFLALKGSFATCPITQGALVRFLVRRGATAAMAFDVLEDRTTATRHVFWPDAVGFSAAMLSGVVGHRQVTDAYLAGLARENRSPLATLDEGLAALHPDVAMLVPEARSSLSL